MDNQVKQTTDGKAKLEAWNGYLAKRRTGAPSRIYFFATLCALAICGMTIIAFINSVIEDPDGTLNLSVWEKWKESHQIGYYLVGLIATVVDVAALDVCGWKIASWIAWRRYRKNITVRRVASWRLALQTAFAALMVLLYAVFPTMFPHPNGRPPYLGLCILCVPIALAAIQLFRASNTQKTKE